MLTRKGLELSDDDYNKTIDVLLKNGNSVSTQIHGSRKILYSDCIMCGYSSVENSLPISNNLTAKQFYNFLASFKKSLYSQIEKNNDLLELNIEYEGLTRFKNIKGWNKLKSPSIFYSIDINSAYWQFAYRLGYISKKIYKSYINKAEYKEVKRYAISFLARENEMFYHDGRKINHIVCDISAFSKVYKNIRNEMYLTIDKIANKLPEFIQKNIDCISVNEKDLEQAKKLFDEMNIEYKVEQCMKIDKIEYYVKGKIRKF